MPDDDDGRRARGLEDSGDTDEARTPLYQNKQFWACGVFLLLLGASAFIVGDAVLLWVRVFASGA